MDNNKEKNIDKDKNTENNSEQVNKENSGTQNFIDKVSEGMHETTELVGERVSESLHATIETLNRIFHRVEEPIHNAVKSVGDNLTKEHLDEVIHSKVMKNFAIFSGFSILTFGLYSLFRSRKVLTK